MHEFLFFTIGFLLGGIAGISTMCLVQINRIRNNQNSRKEEDER
ncbi:DUF3789 domain-containing protein [[Clostridium] innocuum]|nr:DUF3789 domain-containing protein [[Clostridium] innocuum]